MALNTEFRGLLKAKGNVSAAYKQMVFSNPYRVLANNSYDIHELPLDRKYLTQIPLLTDVRNFFYYFYYEFHITNNCKLVSIRIWQ